MNTVLSPSPAYSQLHASLLAQRSSVQSEQVIHAVNRALLAGEMVSAAFYDLTLLKLLQQRKTLPKLSPDAQAEIEAFIDQLTPLMPEKPIDEGQFDKLQHKVAKLSKRFDWQHASPALVKNALFLRTYQRWQQTLEALFSAQDTQLAFTRVKQVLKKSSGRVALLGETHELYCVLQELLANCLEKAAASRDNPDRLTDYIAAADIATRGIITFGATAETVLRGHDLPDSAKLAKRIRQHQTSVIERTHPWFSAM
ncbi:hypothetical protein [uncultured Erwinia sp.]|uniref:hypothetical protein n=1 Tax=uncultured Erwinia sp. TaxID=246798 RepID=UPI0025838FE2|nr:hypothetical protein [uncultured Erwinia sp.]